jgi:uncharacterized protein GlcG (DUF336 family)
MAHKKQKKELRMQTIHRLDCDDAQRIIEAAKKHAEAIGVPMCIAVMDESCHLIGFLRMDGGKIPSITMAIDKCFTATGTQKPTQALAEPSMPGGPVYGLTSAHGGRFVVIAGGLPIFKNGEVIGGIGVSSGTPAQDLEVAQAGVHAFGAESA